MFSKNLRVESSFYTSYYKAWSAIPIHTGRIISCEVRLVPLFFSAISTSTDVLNRSQSAGCMCWGAPKTHYWKQPRWLHLPVFPLHHTPFSVEIKVKFRGTRLILRIEEEKNYNGWPGYVMHIFSLISSVCHLVLTFKHTVHHWFISAVSTKALPAQTLKKGQ